MKKEMDIRNPVLSEGPKINNIWKELPDIKSPHQPLGSRLLLRNYSVKQIEGKKNICCNHCFKFFETINDAKNHIDKNHRALKIDFSKHIRHNSMAKFCILCNKKVSLNHKQKEHSDLKCTICKKICKNSKSFREHLWYHSKKLPYECKYCDYKTAQSSNINLHIFVKHFDKILIYN